MFAVEPSRNSIADPSNKGHNRNNLSIMDTSLGYKCSLSHSTNAFLTSEERTTSLQRLAPMCPLFGGSTYMYTTSTWMSPFSASMHY